MPKKLTKAELEIKVTEMQKIITKYQQDEKKQSSDLNSQNIENKDGGTNSTDDSIMRNILNRLTCLEFTVNRLEKENILLKKDVKSLVNLNKDLEDDLYYLRIDLSSLEQYTRRWNVEVCNIPEEINQDQLKPTIISAFTQMEVPINEDDLEIVHRLGKPKNSNSPANVIIRFKNRNSAYQVMKNKKNSKNIDKSSISPNLKKNLYFQENLCAHYREVLDYCLSKKYSGDLYKVWTFKGVVNILFSDAAGEKVSKIYHYSDLWDLFPDD